MCKKNKKALKIWVNNKILYNVLGALKKSNIEHVEIKNIF